MSTVETPPQGRWRLDRRERRRLGVTIFSVVAKVRELKKRGELDPDDVPGMALEIQGMILADHPHLFQGPGWDEDRFEAILAWIERLLELLMKWLPILFAL